MNNVNSWLIIMIAGLATAMEIIDGFILSVSMPQIMGSLGATLDEATMIATSYSIAAVVILPASAWLSDYFGRRNMFLISLAAFTFSSLACGLAPNVWSLVIFRLIQGLSGGAMLPLSQSLIYEQFPMEKSGTAGSIMGMLVMIGPTLGPVLGGFISDHYGWRMIFNINIPIGLMVLALAWIYIKDSTSEDEAKPTKKFDLVGMVLMVLAIGCLDYALERGPTDEWFDSKVILACVVIASIALPLFILWELTVEEPLVNLRYLGLKPVWVGSMHISISSFTIMSVFFIIPIFLSTAFHFEARQIGELFVPGSAIGIVTMNLAGQLLVRGVPARLLMIFGVLGTEFFLYQLTQFSPMTSWNAILFALMMRGATIAFLFVPLNAAVLGAFRGRDLRAVSGLTNLIRTVAGNAGIAFMAGFFQIQGHQNQTELLSKVNAFQPQAVAAYHQSLASFAKKFGDSLGLVEKTDVAHKMLDLKVNAQVQFVTFIQASHIMMCAGLLLLIPIFLLPPAPRKRDPDEGAVSN